MANLSDNIKNYDSHTATMISTTTKNLDIQMFTASTDKIFKFIKSQQEKIDCISFDVFDTLIRRKIAPPEQVKVASATTVSSILKKYGIKESAKGCLSIRIQIEEMLKRQAQSGKNKPKFHIQEIFQRWLTHFLPAEIAKEEIQMVYKSELDAEFSVCYAPPDIFSLVEGIKSLNKELIFISDMYLGKSHILSILEKNGYEGLFREGFVSSDIGLSKQNGQLFKHVLSQEQIIPERLVHIGDNISADFVQPHSMGIRAILIIDNKYLKWKHNHQKLFNLSQKNLFWEGARWCEMTTHNSDVRLKSTKDLPYAIGYWILGPIFTSFIHQTIIRIAQDGCQTVFFPAREGFILKQLYEILCHSEAFGATPPAQYIFLSRRSTFLSSVTQVGVRELTRGYEKDITLRIIFNKLNLNIDLLKPIIDQHSFYKIDEVIKSPTKNPKLRDFLNHPAFIAFFTAERKNQSEMLFEYLKQFDFWNMSNVAIVDVGWVGTIQESLSRAFMQNDNMPALNGYYMALLNRSSVPVQENNKSKLCGIFFDYRNDSSPAIINRFTELLENSARAPHGSTIGYRRTKDGTVIPALVLLKSASNELSEEDSTIVASLQSGIIEYAEAYKSWLPFQLHCPHANQSFHLAQWERLTKFPNRYEGKLLRKIIHTNEFIGGIAAAGDKSPPVQERRWRFSSSIKKEMVWPEGFYAGLKIPGANLLFNLYRLIFKEDF